jgi:hypothetical protein
MKTDPAEYYLKHGEENENIRFRWVLRGWITSEGAQARLRLQTLTLPELNLRVSLPDCLLVKYHHGVGNQLQKYEN